MRKLFIAILMIATILTPATAFAVTEPLSEMYWMSSSDGVGPGGTAKMQEYLDIVGYNSLRYENTHAYYVRRTMASDVVFSIVSHGDPGRVYCYDGTSVSASIVADDDANYSLDAKFNSGDLDLIKFAYYGSCYSARSDSTYGNLLTFTTNTLGAHSALGYYNAVNDETATYFENRLFYRLCWGDTLAAAKSYALTATYNEFGYYGEVDSCRTSGDTSTLLYPLD